MASRNYSGLLTGWCERDLAFRSLIHTEAGMDHYDRLQRRACLAELGGLAGVREIRRRTAIVRAAKDRVARESARDALTPEELDEVLPPHECRRTRERLSRRA